MAPAPAVSDWTEVNIDLSAYQGQQGYIAIHHVDYDKNYLVIDDFGIYNTEVSEWITKSATSETLDLTGLNPDTEYEWQVQGVNAGCDGGVTDWSSVATFTTTPINITFAKEGYATYFNSRYDIVLPDGMEAKIVTASASNGTLTYETIADGSETKKNVPAGTAVMLQIAPAENPQTISVDYTAASNETVSGNLLRGSDTQTTTTGGNLYYMLSYDQNNENIGWYWANDTGAAFQSKPHKAWLALGSSAPSFLGLPGWDTTGIVPVGVNPEDGEWYTLQGLKVGKKPTTTGVYIHNGRKVIIK